MDSLLALGDLQFSSIVLTGRTQVAAATAAPVYDLLSADGAPWMLILQAGDLTSGSRSIPAESLLFSANGGMLLSLNPGLNPQSMAQETQRSGPLSRPLWVLRGQGGGRWKYLPAAAQFRLQLPAESYAGSYLGTLTATLLRGLP